jgi:DNA-binding MarR family transcriptional regulator
MNTKSTSSQNKTIRHIVDCFRGIMSTEHAAIFMAIATYGPQSITVLADRLGDGEHSVSGSVILLGKGYPRLQGLELVKVEVNWPDRRNDVVSLTAKGKRFLASITASLEATE